MFPVNSIATKILSYVSALVIGFSAGYSYCNDRWKTKDYEAVVTSQKVEIQKLTDLNAHNENIEEQDIDMLGVFFDFEGTRTIRIIKRYKGDEFDSCGINWLSYNYGKPDQVSYELRATIDVAKFISNDEIEVIKAEIPEAQKLSHIKVKNGELVKVYFIEYIKD